MLEVIIIGVAAALAGFGFAAIIGVGDILESYGKLVLRLYETHPMLAKPLGACTTCVCGQFGLWLGLYELHDLRCLLTAFIAVTGALWLQTKI